MSCVTMCMLLVCILCFTENISMIGSTPYMAVIESYTYAIYVVKLGLAGVCMSMALEAPCFPQPDPSFGNSTSYSSAAESCLIRAATPSNDSFGPSTMAICTTLKNCEKSGKASFAFSLFAAMLAFSAVYACWRRRRTCATTASAENLSAADFGALVLSTKRLVSVLSFLTGLSTVIAYGAMQACATSFADVMTNAFAASSNNNPNPSGNAAQFNANSVPSTGGQLSIITFTFSFLVSVLSALSPTDNAGLQLSTLESNLLKHEAIPAGI